MDPQRSKIDDVRNLVLSVAFLVGISLPLLDSLLHIDPSPPLSEQRRLAEPPTLEPSLASLEAFPRGFDAYHDDRFAFRGILVRWFNATKVLGLGVAAGVPVRSRHGERVGGSKVLPGRDGWFFYTEQEAVVDRRGAHPFTSKQLEQWRITLEQIRDWLRERGIPYLVVIAPNKHTIYGEYLPASVKLTGRPTRHDQLVEHLRQTSDIELVDLRFDLLAAKGETPLYSRLDSHWNDLGVLVGYRSIVNRLRALVPSVTPALGREDFVLKTEVQTDRELAKLMGLADLFSEEVLLMEPRVPRQAVRCRSLVRGENNAESFVTERSDAELPTAVIFRDSFFAALQPFLSEHFSRVAYYAQQTFDPAIIRFEQPDVVIHELVERKLNLRPPTNPDEIIDGSASGLPGLATLVLDGSKDQLVSEDGAHVYRLVEGRYRGNLKEHGYLGSRHLIKGWAGNLQTGEAPRAIVLLRGGRTLAWSRVEMPTVTLARTKKLEGLAACGFRLIVKEQDLAGLASLSELSVFALGEGVACPLPLGSLGAALRERFASDLPRVAPPR